MAVSGLTNRTDYAWQSSGHFSGTSYRRPIRAVVLHHNGSTGTGVVPNVWRTREASAHYQIENGEIISTLDESLVAWAVGDWNANTETISIENQNETGAPSWKVWRANEDAAARLVADICRRYGLPINGSTVLPHRHFSATACPGGLDLNYVISQAGGNTQNVAPQTPQQPAMTPPAQAGGNGGTFVVDKASGANVRTSPYVNAPVRADKFLSQGASVAFIGTVHGSSVDGNDIWYKTSVSGLYVWSGGTHIAGGSATPAQAQSTSSLVPQNGTYRANGEMNVRLQPSLNGEIVATVPAGYTCSYDNYVDADGIRWISYIGQSGRRVYIARRKLDNSEIFGEAF